MTVETSLIVTRKSRVSKDRQPAPDANARALFDSEVNFSGTVGASCAVVRVFREVNPPGKGGILLQNSSISGFSAEPGFCILLCKICILQPGIFNTNVLAAAQFLPVHPAYTNSVTAALRDFDSGDPSKFAKMLYQPVHTDDGNEMPLYLPAGRDALKSWQDKLKRMNKVWV